MSPSVACRRIFFSLAFFVVLVSLSGLAVAKRSDIDRIVVFGASLSDTGNAFIWLSENPDCGVSLNVPPYDALDKFAAPAGPYAKGGHHFTNGATWVDGLARYLALSGNVRPAFRNRGPEASNYAGGREPFPIIRAASTCRIRSTPISSTTCNRPPHSPWL
jgi:phospholipase/lecithinase/hemolysin